MKKSILIGIAFLVSKALWGQSFDSGMEQTSLDYSKTKARITEKFKNVKPGKFGEIGPGILTRITTSKKLVALTFDACGGPTGSGYDSALVNYLKMEKIQATLFISGAWIDQNDSLFQRLCKEPLFEIENHGLSHCPCSVIGKSRYGIAGTGNVGEVFDEIELNARRIEFYNKKKPQYYRPAAAAADEGCRNISRELKEKIVTFDVLSGDAVHGVEADAIAKNIVTKTRPGSIVIMHMNHPERNGFEGLKQAIPKLRKLGYDFVKLEGHPLSGKK